MADAYSNRLFGFGSNNNKSSGIRVSSIKPYIGGCPSATKDGKNCNRSLVYTSDGKELNCTEYCVNNCHKWINNMFVEENIPTSIDVSSDNKIIRVGLSYIGIKLSNINGRLIDIGINLPRKGNKKMQLDCKECNNEFKNAGNVLCKYIRDNVNTENLELEIFIELKDNSIFYKDDIKFMNFKNNIRIFKPSRYWILHNGLTLQIKLNS